MEDIILVTIDCWRDDALDAMPQLSAMVEEWNSGSVITAAAATNGAFPAIFSSQFYPELYDDNGSIPEHTESIPSLLSKHGYSTGGFVASNPYLGKWSEHFDSWWNDGMSANGMDTDGEEWNYTITGKLKQLSSLQPRVPAENVLRRADNWWEQTDGPRFLWVHLMEPHEPYLPGFKNGREIGLVKSYTSIAGYSVLNQKTPAWIQRHLKQLHYQSNKKLDDILTPWLKSHKDSTVILTGDHGEEFDHGFIGHGRLYDETVRVPLLSNNMFKSIQKSEFIRQFDIAPILLSNVDITMPDVWEGTTAVDETQSQEMITCGPRVERDWVGIRSKSWKLIYTYDWDEGFQGHEAYHLQSDPNETQSKPISSVPNSLKDKLETFLERPAISREISLKEEMKTGLNSEVESRLKELGYKE